MSLFKKKKISGTYFKPSSHALKYSENRRKSTKKSRQLLLEVQRLGSYRGYDISPFPPTGAGKGPALVWVSSVW